MNPFLQYGQTSPTNYPNHRQQAQQPNNRNRKVPRDTSQSLLSGTRQMKTMRDFAQEASAAAYRARFEAGRSFDLDDDFEFCPALLTEDDYQSISSAASSDRSSLASGSPDLSPTLVHSQPTNGMPSFSNFNPSAAFFQSSTAHAQEPTSGRHNNAAPNSYPPKAPSPSASISPSRLHQGYGRRW